MNTSKTLFQSVRFLSFAFILMLSVYSNGQSEKMMSDKELVHAAVEDYVLGLYEVSPERIEKSVHKDLRKIGYYEYNGEAYSNVPMTYQQLYDLSAKWNIKGDQVTEETPKIIEIYSVHDKTASAKLTAKWGIDFMHLGKVDGVWKIMNIIWQSDPK
ncbi:MAG: nuclear transport factor 2 family protein [Saprospiraceae bacterium]|nr:nuclear transport factor 2 family protein [Saprospiraceae bacterium]